eukprot:12029459-Heterocapsa_arctica.AAC.1
MRLPLLPPRPRSARGQCSSRVRSSRTPRPAAPATGTPRRNACRGLRRCRGHASAGAPAASGRRRPPPRARPPEPGWPP